jgi:hypothetical protein
MTILNQNLIDKQELTPDEVAEIEQLHVVREELFDIADDCDLDDPASVATLRTMAALLESLEFDMQRVWKFPQDRSFHSWWFRIPHCQCPKMDNADPIYFGNRIFSGNCPVHSGGFIGEDNE